MEIREKYLYQYAEERLENEMVTEIGQEKS